jgi:hypothetical protein
MAMIIALPFAFPLAIYVDLNPRATIDMLTEFYPLILITHT